MNQYFINIDKNNQVKLSFKSPPDLVTFIQTMQTAILSALQSARDKSPDPEKATEDLYQLYNLAASRTLSYFAPELEMRPHLTTEAILKMENEILNSQEKQ